MSTDLDSPHSVGPRTIARPAIQPVPVDLASSNLWERIAAIGARASDTPPERRRMRVTNQGAVIGCVNIGFFAIGYALAGFFDLAAMSVVGFLVTAAVLPLQARGHRHIAPFATLLPANSIVLVAALRFGPSTGFHDYTFIFAAVAFLIGTNAMARWSLALLAALVFALVEAFGAPPGTVAIPPLLRSGLALFSGLSSMTIVAFLIGVFRTDAESTERLLAIEHERSERLLLNVLPKPIAERLKADERTIADAFGEVTVLFADIAGFTELSQRLDAQALVQLLNRIFQEFDALSDHHGLEKIKTIGDCYMVAGGLTGESAGHTARVARMGLDMLARLETINRETGHTLALRVGINTGPVVAGVIGKRKFIYDLWGDTVNTASRMESSGAKGRVHTTRRTYELLDGQFSFEARGKIQVKGKGEMETFFLDRESV